MSSGAANSSGFREDGRAFICDSVELVAWDGGIDGAGPGVDAAGEGLGALEALVAEPHGHGERALAVVTEDNDGGVGVELGVGAGGDVAHGHQDGVRQGGGVELPGLANVEEDRGVGRWGGAELGEGLRGDFRVEGR